MRIVVIGVVFAGFLLPGTASACSWPTKSDLDTTNVAFPDEGAT
jgi:hypothetical protein